MWMRAALITVMMAGGPALALAADPVGHYSVEGTNPDGHGTYSGEVAVTKTGDTYKIVWKIGGEEYVGTAVGDSKFLGMSYKSGDETGLALYGDSGSGWTGIWTYAGSRTLGTERWTRE